MNKAVFISHATDDQATAAEVCKLLEANGVPCWIAPRDVTTGAQWDDAIIDAIESAHAFLLILSAKANESPYVKNEVNHAFGARKTIFTFRIEDVMPGKSLGFYLARHHWADGFPRPLGKKVEALAAVICADVQARAAQGDGITSAAATPPLKLSGLARLRASTTRIFRRERPSWALVATLAVAVAALAVPAMRRMRETAPDAPETRVDIVTPATNRPGDFALSPDGREIVFVATADGQSRLWVRSLESGSARVLKGTDGATAPFWSPDSRSIGFFAEGQLRRFDLDGGSLRIIAAAPNGQNGAWGRGDVILFASNGRPIARVPSAGGQPVEMSGLARLGSDYWPQFLPDGRHFLYFLRGVPEARGVYVGQLDEKQDRRRLLESDSGAVYSPSGHLLYIRQDTLFAQQFDPIKLELTGSPIVMAEHVAGSGLAGASVSSGGAIAYRTTMTGAKRQLVWYDRSGKVLGNVGDPVSTTLSGPSLSRDGQHVALYRPVDGNVDIWLVESKRGVLSRFTTNPADDVMPVWSPGGDRIVFTSNRKGVLDLYMKPLAGSGTEELLLSTPEPKNSTDWSADGRFVLFDSQSPTGSIDIWALPLDGDGKPFPVVQTSFTEQRGQISPDVHWVAYQSNESGRAEIYVQSFPGPAAKWPISVNGGSQARWRPDGKELFYVAPDGRLMAASFRVSAHDQNPEVGAPQVLFTLPLGGSVQQGDWRHQYLVSADGRQFLVAAVTEEASAPITLLLNWKGGPAAGDKK